MQIMNREERKKDMASSKLQCVMSNRKVALYLLYCSLTPNPTQYARSTRSIRYLQLVLPIERSFCGPGSFVIEESLLEICCCSIECQYRQGNVMFHFLRISFISISLPSLSFPS